MTPFTWPRSRASCWADRKPESEIPQHVRAASGPPSSLGVGCRLSSGARSELVRAAVDVAGDLLAPPLTGRGVGCDLVDLGEGARVGHAELRDVAQRLHVGDE